jgi:hypothetical protein
MRPGPRFARSRVRLPTATDKEQVLLTGGGPDDGDQLLMTSYRSEIGGIASRLAVIGTLVRSGKINVKTIEFVCDNEAAITACRRKRTQSVFRRTEGDHDRILTIHFLQENRCQDTDVRHEWAKGRADELNRDPTKLERMNIVSDELCDVIRETARFPFGARPNCGLWPSERCALFIRVVKVTSNWKERLTQQLLDRDLQEYLMQKEQWTLHAFNNICWKRKETASKKITKARQASTKNMCHNLRFTGARHELWYGKTTP